MRLLIFFIVLITALYLVHAGMETFENYAENLNKRLDNQAKLYQED